MKGDILCSLFVNGILCKFVLEMQSFSSSYTFIQNCSSSKSLMQVIRQCVRVLYNYNHGSDPQETEAVKQVFWPNKKMRMPKHFGLTIITFVFFCFFSSFYF